MVARPTICHMKHNIVEPIALCVISVASRSPIRSLSVESLNFPHVKIVFVFIFHSSLEMLGQLLKVAAWGSTLIAILLNLYIYTYPSLDPDNCSWSRKDKDYDALSIVGQSILKVPYLGDLYDTYWIPEQPSSDIHLLAVGDPQIDGRWAHTDTRKRLDIFGNDHYLGHIYRVMSHRLAPDYVTVLGDLFGSHWIEDSEFYNRTKRYTTRLFSRDVPQPGSTLLENDSLEEYTEWYRQALETGLFSDPGYCGYQDIKSWGDQGPLFINITGNHDIGYGGDMTWARMYRWNKYFGKDNYFVEYALDTDHPWRLVMVDALQLDGPSQTPEFQQAVWQFVDGLASRPFNGTTILVTHIPLYKPDGICKDGTRIEYYDNGLIKVENHLKFSTSQRLLNSLFGNGKPGIILTGHDHEGCISYYADSDGKWAVSSEPGNSTVKELTVRSIMGDFDGNTGLVTGHFNSTTANWEFDYSVCPFIVQHFWWAAQVAILVASALQSVSFLFNR